MRLWNLLLSFLIIAFHISFDRPVILTIPNNWIFTNANYAWYWHLNMSKKCVYCMACYSTVSTTTTASTMTTASSWNAHSQINTMDMNLNWWMQYMYATYECKWLNGISIYNAMSTPIEWRKVKPIVILPCRLLCSMCCVLCANTPPNVPQLYNIRVNIVCHIFSKTYPHIGPYISSI